MRHGSDAAERLWWAPGPAPAPQTLVSCCGSSNPIHWPLAVLAAYVSAMPATTKASRAAAGPAGGRSDQAFNWAPAALHLAARARPEVSLPLARPLLLPAATKSPWRRRPAASCLRPPPPYSRNQSRPIPPSCADFSLARVHTLLPTQAFKRLTRALAGLFSLLAAPLGRRLLKMREGGVGRRHLYYPGAVWCQLLTFVWKRGE